MAEKKELAVTEEKVVEIEIFCNTKEYVQFAIEIEYAWY